MEYFKTVNNDFTVLNPDTPVTESEAKHMLQVVQSALTDSKKVAILTNVTGYQSEEVEIMCPNALKIEATAKYKVIDKLGLKGHVHPDAMDIEVLSKESVYSFENSYSNALPTYEVEWRDGGVVSSKGSFDSIEDAKAYILDAAQKATPRSMFGYLGTHIRIVPSKDLRDVSFSLRIDYKVKVKVTYSVNSTQYLVA